MSIDIDLSLGASIDTLSRDVRANTAARRHEIEVAKARTPWTNTLQVAGTCPTPTAPFALSFGGPDAGYYWMVRRVTVGGVLWSTAAAGTAEEYVSGSNPLTGSQTGFTRTVTDLVDQAASLPSKAYYGDGQLIVNGGQSLFLVIVTGTAGQLYTASAFIQGFRTLPEKQFVEGA